MWGRKKPPSSHAPSKAPLISHVFPTSWISKFKQKINHSETKPRKAKPKGLSNYPSMNSSKYAMGGGTGSSSNGGKFYGFEDDEQFWRFSFKQDSSQEKNKSRDVLQSVWYDSDDEYEVSSSSFRKFRRNALIEDTQGQKLNAMKICTREKDKERFYRDKQVVLRTPRRKNAANLNLNKMGREGFVNKALESGRYSGKAETIASNRERYSYHVPPIELRNSRLKKIEEEAKYFEESEEEIFEEKISTLQQNLKELEIEKMKSKSEKQRKSLYITRELQRRRAKQCSNKVRTYSPRTASRLEVCKIKAIEDMKKEKLKMKKKEAKKTRMESTASLDDSFAVVKCSYDPQKDFRDSMIEMIVENKINQPEQLEELLACYLSLNSDEYHDLIIKVFRQLWFDIDQTCLITNSQNEQHC